MEILGEMLAEAEQQMTPGKKRKEKKREIVRDAKPQLDGLFSIFGSTQLHSRTCYGLCFLLLQDTN